jgi:hypothetical protein
MTELFAHVAEASEPTARIWRIIVCLAAFIVGVAGSYSGLFGGGVHSGVGLGFLASATVLGGAGILIGLLVSGSQSSRATGLTIAGAGLGLLLGAWTPFVIVLGRFL